MIFYRIPYNSTLGGLLYIHQKSRPFSSQTLTQALVITILASESGERVRGRRGLTFHATLELAVQLLVHLLRISPVPQN